MVNGHAVDITPGPLGEYLRAHRKEIVAWAVAADDRKTEDPAERHKHYIDFELFEDPPTPAIPLDRSMAEARYTAAGMVKGGTLLWVLPEVVLSLRDAMAAGDWDRALAQAADLGHYLADGHQPLHTTVNYDGQETGNRGVHYMFESVMTQHKDESESISHLSKQTALKIGLQIEDLASAVDSNDYSNLRTMAASLGSTAIEHGITSIAEVAVWLEHSTSTEQDPCEITQLAIDLLDLCRKSQRSYLNDCEQMEFSQLDSSSELEAAPSLA
ncbi:MAG: hypothetical protein IH835_07640 [Proteobacteria bacterium]|nr:hypothetical protein [Pseudomonadota bacterium]